MRDSGGERAKNFWEMGGRRWESVDSGKWSVLGGHGVAAMGEEDLNGVDRVEGLHRFIWSTAGLVLSSIHAKRSI